MINTKLFKIKQYSSTQTSTKTGENKVPKRNKKRVREGEISKVAKPQSKPF